ncbi:MAG: ferritin [Thermotogae bacterium]|nr:ferritin [Thermotogota bacterium]HOO75246.1 ferritin [Tepiditoga sp.]
MKLNEKMEAALNEQINREFYSSFLYLSMSAYFERNNLKGFANWMNIQYKEETAHAMGLYGYIISRGGKVILKEIKKPEAEWENALEIFKAAKKHEEFITDSINSLMDLANELKEYATVNFLKWYVNEQVEEEENVTEIVDKLEMFGEVKQALYMLDNELAARVFTEPVITA